MRKLSEVLQMLDEIPFSSDEADVEAMYKLVDVIREMENPRECIPYIFLWFEKNSGYDLGQPGPLVHFIEKSQEYIDALKDSLHRKPTDKTLWMANRIANSKNNLSDIHSWIEILKAASRHPLADAVAIESAIDFVEHQSSRLN